MNNNRARHGGRRGSGSGFAAVLGLMLPLVSPPELAAGEPAGIAAHPSSMAVAEGCPATFAAEISGTEPVSLQWLRNGEALAQQTNASLTLPSVSLSDDGAQFQLAATNAFGGNISAPAVLSVLLDVVPPVVEEAGGDASRTRVYVRFGGACSGRTMDRASAEEIGNYGLDGGLTVLAASLDASGTLVTLTTSRQQPGTSYTLTVQNVRDASGNAVEPGSSVTFRSRVTNAEALWFEAFWDFGACANGNCPPFPCSDFLLEGHTFDRFSTANAFTSPTEFRSCVRMSGYFRPPISGSWIFYVRSVAPSRLYLGTNGADPNAVRAIVSTPFRPQPVIVESSPVFLRGGQPVYLELGAARVDPGDPVRVSAKLASDPTPPEDLPPLPPEYLSAYHDDAARLFTIRQPPRDLVVQAGTQARLEVDVSVGSLNLQAPYPYIHYQWERRDPGETRWKDIPGATAAVSLTAPEFICNAFDPSRYRCRLITAGARTWTAEATLRVAYDDYPVTIGKVEPTPNLKGVKVTFSEIVTRDSAGDLFNYRIDGLGIDDVLILNERSVLLRTPPQTPGAYYALVVNGIHDLSDPACGTHGEIFPDTTVTFQALQLVHGAAVREIFRQIPGLGLPELRANERFPDRPDQVDAVVELDGGTKAAGLNLADDYGLRISGFLCPPATQAYDFYLASDEQGEFWLSTDETPDSLQLISQEFGWNEWRQWEGPFTSELPLPSWSRALFPRGITLERGRRYYFEALMKERSGNDHLAVAWTRAGDPIPANGSAPISGQALACYGRAIEIRPVGDSLELSWTLGGTLMTAPAAGGPWTAVESSTNHVTLPRPMEMRFFRARYSP